MKKKRVGDVAGQNSLVLPKRYKDPRGISVDLKNTPRTLEKKSEPP